MKIIDFLKELNFNKRILYALIGLLISAIPIVWVLSSKNTIKNSRINNIETSIVEMKQDVRSLHTKFDSAEERFNKQYIDGINKVGEIVKLSSESQTKQLMFVIDNWKEDNRNLIRSAIELRQEQNEIDIEKIIDGIVNGLKDDTPIVTDAGILVFPKEESKEIIVKLKEEPRPEIYTKDNATLMDVEKISREYKILLLELNPNQTYKIKYRDLTSVEKKEKEYFDKF